MLSNSGISYLRRVLPAAALILLLAGPALCAQLPLIIGGSPPVEAGAAFEGAHPALQSASRFRSVELLPDIAAFGAVVEGDELLLDLFPGSEYAAGVDRVYEDVQGVVSVRGRFLDCPLSYVIISTHEGRSLVNIKVFDETLRTYRIFWEPSAGTHYLLEMDPAAEPEAAEGPALIPAPPGEDELEEIEIIRDGVANLGPNDPATVDVMVVYTSRARTWASANAGGIANVVAQSMETAQLVQDNSNTRVTMRLVHSGEVNYAETGDSIVDLRRVTGWDERGNPVTGYMQEARRWRDDYAADLVALFTETGNSAGVAWALTDPSGRPNYGYSVTMVEYAGSTYTHVHEMSHNMGAGHHKLQSVQPGPQMFDYSAGWRWTGSGRWCSIMTYEAGRFFADGQDHRRVPHLSNPGVSLHATPTGHASHGDNARTVRATKHAVAAYRTRAVGVGSIRVTINPADVRASARWRRAGTTAWRESGTTETGVPAGSYRVEFNDVSGWIKPAAVSIAVNSGQTTAVSAEYTRSGQQVMYPSGGITLTNPRPTFSWSRAAGATWYKVYMQKDGAFYWEFWVEGAVSWVPTWDLPAGSYSWWVMPWGPTGSHPWSQRADFSISGAGGAPGRVTQVAPQGPQANTTLTYRWRKDSRATWYELYILAEGGSPWSKWFAGTGTGEMTVTVSGHRPGIEYQWWVRPWGPGGFGPWSSGMRLGAMYPSGGVVLSNRRPVITWPATRGATHYQLYIERDGRVFADGWFTFTSGRPDRDWPDGAYRWWIRPWGQGIGYGAWYPGATFSIRAGADMDAPFAFEAGEEVLVPE